MEEVSNSIARGGTVVDTVYNINSIEDCKQLCTDNTNCDGITWERNTSQGSKCTLNSGISYYDPVSGYSSYIKDSYTPPAGNFFSKTGNNIGCRADGQSLSSDMYTTIPNIGNEECKSRCRSDFGCKGYEIDNINGNCFIWNVYPTTYIPSSNRECFIRDTIEPPSECIKLAGRFSNQIRNLCNGTWTIVSTSQFGKWRINTGNEIELSTGLLDDRSRFRFIKDGDYFYIKSVYNNRWVYANSPLIGDDKLLADGGGDATESKWRIVENGEGFIKFVSFWGQLGRT